MNYKKIYDSLIERAKSRVLTGYHERHHILPRSMGGDSDKKNLVKLTPEEHFLAHLLLLKIYPDQPNLIFAVNQMMQGHFGKRVNRKMYGWLKRKFSDTVSKLQTGEGNSQFGSRWINNGTVNRKLKQGEQIRQPWKYGKIKKLFRSSLCIICAKETGLARARFCDSHRGLNEERRREKIRAFRKTRKASIAQ